MAGRAYIVGGGFTNKGGEAMTLTVARALRDRFPGVAPLVRVQPAETAVARAHGLRPVVARKAVGVGARIASKAATALTVLSYDAMLDVGGYQFGDSWGAGLPRNKARLMRTLRRMGKPTFFLPQAWGPFRDPAVAATVRDVLDAAEIAFVRDETSMREVEAVAGRGHRAVQFAHDIAWTFEAAPDAEGERLLREAFKGERPARVVCLTPNLRVLERSEGEGDRNVYLRTLVRTAERLAHHGVATLLLGHELRQSADARPDDRALCRRTLAALGPGVPAGHLDRAVDAAEVKALIGRCEALIGSRYHAIIAAASQGVPPLVAGWSHKYDELLKEIGMPGRALPVTADAGAVDAAVDDFLRDAPGLRGELATRVPPLRESAAGALRRVMDALEAA